MKDALEFIIKSIVTIPEEVKIEEKEIDGVINFTVSVATVDVGRLIGKEGKVIKAIRTIARVIAIQRGLRVRVSVLSDLDKDTTQSNVPEIVDDSITVEV